MTDPSPQPAKPDDPVPPSSEADGGNEQYLLDQTPTTVSPNALAEIRLIATGAALQTRRWVLASVLLVLAFVIAATALNASPYVTGSVAVLALVALMMAEIRRGA